MSIEFTTTTTTTTEYPQDIFAEVVLYGIIVLFIIFLLIVLYWILDVLIQITKELCCKNDYKNEYTNIDQI